MKTLTKQEAIANHRRMWNWIADETERQTMIVGEKEYFEASGITNIPFGICYCCEYANQRKEVLQTGTTCKNCPINWGENGNTCAVLYNEQGEHVGDGLYCQWHNAIHWPEAAELAREIANSPER